MIKTHFETPVNTEKPYNSIIKLENVNQLKIIFGIICDLKYSTPFYSSNKNKTLWLFQD